MLAIVIGVVVAVGTGDDASSDTDHSAAVVEETDAAAEQASRRAEEEASREAEEASREAEEEASRRAQEEAEREAEEAQRRAEEEERRRAEEEARAAAEAERLDPESYSAISDRDWALVERDPDASTGNRYVLYGRVTQFDSNTGPESFRVNTAGEPKADWYDYEINTIAIASDAEIVSDVVADDLVTMHVEVVGAFSYTTTLGGEMTVPLVQVNIIEVDGSV